MLCLSDVAAHQIIHMYLALSKLHCSFVFVSVIQTEMAA